MKSLRVLLLSLGCVGLLATQAVAAPTIVLDAGHGGHDRGGVPGQKYSEKAATLSVAKKTASRLRSAGFRVVLTRSDDTFIGLSERCRIANSQGSAVFLSIHFNSAPRKTASGVETYYYSSRSAGFAAAVHREVLRVMDTENRGVRQRGFFVIRRTNVPAVLIESGFLSNPVEGKRLSSASMQDKLAGALARAVISKYK